MAYCILKFNNAQRSRNTRWQPTRRATASVLPGAQRLPADCFCRHRLRLEAIALGISWVGWHNPEAPSLAAAKGIQDTAVDLVSEEVTWLVLVWFGRQRGMKSWVFDGLYFFKAPWTVFSVLGAVGGCRVLRCGRSGGPPPRD